MLIDQSATICTVIVTVDGEAEDLEFVAGHASEGLEQFSQFEGFIAGATHISEDGERVIQYLQWESEEAHEACMVGDRLTTDVRMAARAGLTSCLVLSGVTSREELAQAEDRPTHVFESIAGVHAWATGQGGA